MNSFLPGILDYSIKIGASDVYIYEGKEVTFRVNGELVKIEGGSIDSINIKEILKELLKGNTDLINQFYNNRDLDFAYFYEGFSNFRVNASHSLGKINFVMRRIMNTAVPIDDLKLPPGVKKFLTLKDGLILITGPTGAGKSTTMVSMLEEINKTRKEHIVTIEDPIEFIFTDDKSFFCQREMGSDTKNMASGLKAVVREDPNIIMIGELRDKETVEAALEIAGTGHLVISTLHTSSAAQTLSRLISFFEPALQEGIKNKLGDVISGILCQRLIKRSDGKGRIGIYELMLPTSGIRNLVRSGEFSKIKSEIETGKQFGMITMHDYANRLGEKGLINKEDYEKYFMDDM